MRAGAYNRADAERASLQQTGRWAWTLGREPNMGCWAEGLLIGSGLDVGFTHGLDVELEAWITGADTGHKCGLGVLDLQLE